MEMKLHAKEDGLWLELKSNKSKRSAMINLSATSRESNTIITAVLQEIFSEIIEEERRQVILDLEDYALARKLLSLARGFKHETQWILEEAIQRMGVDLDEEDDS